MFLRSQLLELVIDVFDILSVIIFPVVRDSKEGLAWDGGLDQFLVKREALRAPPEVRPREVSVYVILTALRAGADVRTLLTRS